MISVDLPGRLAEAAFGCFGNVKMRHFDYWTEEDARL